jgi:hypothetical protein
MSLKSSGNTRTDLAHLVKKLSKHCKDNQLQAIVCYEAGTPGNVAIAGFFSDAMIKSLVVNLCISKGKVVQEALDSFAVMAEEYKSRIPDPVKNEDAHHADTTPDET